MDALKMSIPKMPNISMPKMPNISMPKMPNISANITNNAAKIFNILAFQGSIIVPAGIIMATLFTSNLIKGVIYLFFLIVAVLLRYVFRSMNGITGEQLCDKFSTFNADPTDSIFVLSYTLAYVCGPTISNPNLYILIALLLYLSLTIGLVLYNGCAKIKIIIFELIFGILFAILFMICIIIPLSGTAFIIGDTKSSAEKCNLPSSEKFKCTVANNGEIV